MPSTYLKTCCYPPPNYFLINFTEIPSTISHSLLWLHQWLNSLPWQKLLSYSPLKPFEIPWRTKNPSLGNTNMEHLETKTEFLCQSPGLVCVHRAFWQTTLWGLSLLVGLLVVISVGAYLQSKVCIRENKYLFVVVVLCWRPIGGEMWYLYRWIVAVKCIEALVWSCYDLDLCKFLSYFAWYRMLLAWALKAKRVTRQSSVRFFV